MIRHTSSVLLVIFSGLSACGTGPNKAHIAQNDNVPVKFEEFSYPGLDSSHVLNLTRAEDLGMDWRSVDSTFVRFLFDEVGHGDYDAVVQNSTGEHLKTIYRGAFKRGINEMKFKYAHLEPGPYRWLMTDYSTGDTVQWSAWELLPIEGVRAP
jgi:hypothetical protein